jgi:hypothetical protein
MRSYEQEQMGRAEKRGFELVEQSEGLSEKKTLEANELRKKYRIKQKTKRPRWATRKSGFFDPC